MVPDSHRGDQGCGLCKVCSGQFSPDTSGLPCQYYSTNAPYPSSFSLNTTFVRRTSGLSAGPLKQRSPLLDVGEHWTEKYFHVVSGNARG